jgi:hypothetical protein
MDRQDVGRFVESCYRHLMKPSRAKGLTSGLRQSNLSEEKLATREQPDSLYTGRLVAGRIAPCSKRKRPVPLKDEAFLRNSGGSSQEPERTLRRALVVEVGCLLRGGRGGSAGADHVGSRRDERSDRDDLGLAGNAEVVLAGALVADASRGVDRAGGPATTELNGEARAAGVRVGHTADGHALGVIHRLQARQTHVRQRVVGNLTIGGERRGGRESNDGGECVEALHLKNLQISKGCGTGMHN